MSEIKETVELLRDNAFGLLELADQYKEAGEEEAVAKVERESVKLFQVCGWLDELEERRGKDE